LRVLKKQGGVGLACRRQVMAHYISPVCRQAGFQAEDGV